MTAPAELDRRFARAYAAVAAPVVASAALAPSPAAWAGAWALVVAAVAVNRELRIRHRAARPARPALSLVTAPADSGKDSAGQHARTAA